MHSLISIRKMLFRPSGRVLYTPKSPTRLYVVRFEEDAGVLTPVQYATWHHSGIRTLGATRCARLFPPYVEPSQEYPPYRHVSDMYLYEALSVVSLNSKPSCRNFPSWS